MGFFGSVGRLAGRAALRGTGQLVAVVVPDSMSPWDLRKKSVRTSGSLLSTGLRALAKRKKRKTSSKKSAKASTRATRAAAAIPSAFLPWPGWPSLSLNVPALSRNKKPSTKKAGSVRASTTKGKANLSRRSASTTSPVIVVHAPADSAQRFNKNAWARGSGLVSTTDWDTPSPNKWKPTSRLKRAGRRKKRLVNDRHKEHSQYLKTQAR
jgi:hypothetical protein